MPDPRTLAVVGDGIAAVPGQEGVSASVAIAYTLEDEE